MVNFRNEGDSEGAALALINSEVALEGPLG